MGRPSSSVLVDGELHKQCPKCGLLKPHSGYSKNKNRAHGIQGVCKPCGIIRAKNWNAKNPERYRANARRWEANNPEQHAATSAKYHEENREKKLAASNAWHLENKDRANAARKARRDANIEYERERMREYCKKNRHIFNAKSARRKVRLNQGYRPFDKELFDLVESEAYSLAILREVATGIKWNVDHVIPICSPKLQSLNGNTFPPKHFCGPLFPIVTGLQNEYNFAVIPAVDNFKKSNRRWPDMP